MREKDDVQKRKGETLALKRTSMCALASLLDWRWRVEARAQSSNDHSRLFRRLLSPLSVFPSQHLELVLDHPRLDEHHEHR